MISKTKNISVRLDASVADLIDRRAAERGQDRSDFLRHLIGQSLAGGGGEELREEITALREQVRRGRDDVARLAVLVLTRHPSSEPLTVEQARATVLKALAR